MWPKMGFYTRHTYPHFAHPYIISACTLMVFIMTLKIIYSSEFNKISLLLCVLRHVWQESCTVAKIFTPELSLRESVCEERWSFCNISLDSEPIPHQAIHRSPLTCTTARWKQTEKSSASSHKHEELTSSRRGVDLHAYWKHGLILFQVTPSFGVYPVFIQSQNIQADGLPLMTCFGSCQGRWGNGGSTGGN